MPVSSVNGLTIARKASCSAPVHVARTDTLPPIWPKLGAGGMLPVAGVDAAGAEAAGVAGAADAGADAAGVAGATDAGTLAGAALGEAPLELQAANASEA